MWNERIDDYVRAEGIAGVDYELLFVERGTVLCATRDYRLLTLRDILETHKVANAERFIQPNPLVGGWSKFVRTHILSGQCKGISPASEDMCQLEGGTKKVQQLKKGGRGWLHV